MKIFDFKVRWYPLYDDDCYDGRDDIGLVMADSMGEAVEKIEKRFPDTDTIDIHLVDLDDFLFITEEVYEKLHNEDYTNGDYVIGE